MPVLKPDGKGRAGAHAPRQPSNAAGRAGQLKCVLQAVLCSSLCLEDGQDMSRGNSDVSAIPRHGQRRDASWKVAGVSCGVTICNQSPSGMQEDHHQWQHARATPLLHMWRLPPG